MAVLFEASNVILFLKLPSIVTNPLKLDSPTGFEIVRVRLDVGL